MSKTNSATVTAEMIQALASVKAGRGETANLNTLHALARRGLVSLNVRVVKTSRTGREYDVTVRAL